MARILQVCNSDFYLMHFLVPLVRGLVRAGHEVECVCEGDALDHDALGREVRVHRFDFPRENSPWQFARAIQQMRGLLRAGRYDCVDAHNRNASIVGRVAGWMERVPVNLYTAHGFYFHDGQRGLVREATIGLEAVLARITDFTLSQSSEDVELMTRRRLIDRARIEAIGNGIDTRRFAPRAAGEREGLERSLGLRSGRLRVASTGRVVRGKGLSDLLAAFARLHRAHPDSELLIIGGNIRQDIEPFQAEFLEQARALGVADAMVVTGIVKRVEDYLAVSDAFVLASYREGMPRAVLEAMSMELPVVVTEIRGCREIVAHGENGLLFAPRDVERLSAHLETLHADAALRARLGQRARERVCASFDEVDYVARQVATINRLVGHVAAPASRSNGHGAVREAVG